MYIDLLILFSPKTSKKLLMNFQKKYVGFSNIVANVEINIDFVLKSP